MIQFVDFPKQRRHTYHFLSDARRTAPVSLTTDIDMSTIKTERRRYSENGQRISYITFLIKAISKVITLYPRANSTMIDGWKPKLALYDRVMAKFTLDKTTKGERIVVAAVIEDSDKLDELAIQHIVDNYKEYEYEESKQFQQLRKLNSIFTPLGKIIYKLILANAAKRQAAQGSFTVTSLGHRPVNMFCPISSNTLAFGIGAIMDSVIACDGEVSIRPMMTLTMVFDHRVIDGGMAADILNDIKIEIERFKLNRD